MLQGKVLVQPGPEAAHDSHGLTVEIAPYGKASIGIINATLLEEWHTTWFAGPS